MRYKMQTMVLVAASATALIPTFEADSLFIEQQAQTQESRIDPYDIGSTVFMLDPPHIEPISSHVKIVADNYVTDNDKTTRLIDNRIAERPDELLAQFYETLISPINETVPSDKMYDIDPSIVREAVLLLIEDGFTIQGASATVGALMTESRLDPAVSNGHGIAQWQGERRRRVNPLPTDSLEQQMIKMLHEMKQSYAGVYADMRDPYASLEQTIAAMHRYEGESITGNRKVLARNLFELLSVGYMLALQK